MNVHNGALVGATVTVHLSNFTFLSHLFPLSCGAIVQVPVMGSSQVLLCLFPGVLWL